jgi:hypothetical protein
MICKHEPFENVCDPVTSLAYLVSLVAEVGLFERSTCHPTFNQIAEETIGLPKSGSQKLGFDLTKTWCSGR